MSFTPDFQSALVLADDMREEATRAGVRRADFFPYLLHHDDLTDRAVLLVHGFTATPYETRELGELLHQKGHNVCGVRLSGHSTTVEDLETQTHHDWYRSVLKGYGVVSNLSSRVFVIGISTGGTLLLRLAAETPVAGIVSLASAIFLVNPLARHASILKTIRRYSVTPLLEGEEGYYYDKRPLAAVAELIKLMRLVRLKKIQNITAPIMVVQSRTDPTVAPQSAEFIYQNVRSREKNLVWLDDSPHVVISDHNPKKRLVFEKIFQFIDTPGKNGETENRL
ncbi:MAG: alpha/beta fold hydrolase [Proteobacteria bacterium]|nr:alpha/beta fold hydrolase [Pseudomonadota bacterium]